MKKVVLIIFSLYIGTAFIIVSKHVQAANGSCSSSQSGTYLITTGSGNSGGTNTWVDLNLDRGNGDYNNVGYGTKIGVFHPSPNSYNYLGYGIYEETMDVITDDGQYYNTDCGGYFLTPAPNPTPTPVPVTGSIFVTSDQLITYCLDWGIGCHTDRGQTFTQLPFHTYTITVTSGQTCDFIPPSCQNAPSCQITSSNPDKGFALTCSVVPTPTPTPTPPPDTTAPTGTITAIPNPTGVRLTSSGQSVGTISGTASDVGRGVTAISTVIREWDGAGGAEGDCGVHNHDWSGSAWVAACTVTNWNTVIAATLSTNWSTANTPTTAQMTVGRRYHIYLQVQDAAGNTSGWTPNVSILYSPNTPPTVSNVTSTVPDYCTTGPGDTVSWTFSDAQDPQGQTSYEVQIFSNAGGGGTKYIDSGKINSSATTYLATGLSWNNNYYPRVQVWDSQGVGSGWVDQSRYCPGGGVSCSLTSLFSTPAHSYPVNVNSFTINPSKPLINQVVQFNHGSTQCYKNPANTPDTCTWSWNFGDGNLSSLQDPTHAYTVVGAYSVTLTATDQSGQSCTANPAKSVKIQRIPSWKEVLPQ